MSYPAYPSGRWAYDCDRSRVFLVDTVATEVTGSTLDALNGLDADALSSTDRGKSVVFLFPELRRTTGVRVYSDGAGQFRLDYCAEHITPDDILTATWVDRGYLNTSTSSNYRQGIQGLRPTEVGAIRISEVGAGSPSAGLGPIHLFGVLMRSDRVALWDPQLDQPLLGRHFEWKDAPQGTGYRYPFRIRNLSEVYSANNVTVSCEDVGSPSSPAIASQMLFSTDGDNFTASVTVPEVGPSTVSGALWLACEVSVTAELGLWPFRVHVNAESWS